MSTSAQTHETALAEVVVFVVTHLPAGAVFKDRCGQRLREREMHDVPALK